MKKNFVLRSTSKSRETGVPSLLAYLEIFVACFLAFLLYRLGANLNIFTLGLLALPVAALRSDAGAQLAARWWLGEGRRELQGTALLLVLGISISSGVAAFANYEHWFDRAVSDDGVGVPEQALWAGVVGLAIFRLMSRILYFWADFSTYAFGHSAAISIILGAVCSVIGLVEIKNANLDIVVVIFIVIAGASLVLTVFGELLIILILANLRSFLPGLRSLPRNWMQLVFVDDFCKVPVPIPGAEDKVGSFSFSGIHKFIGAETRVSSKDDGFYTYAFFVLGWVQATIIRLSIKSTAPLYLPILYVTTDSDLSEEKALKSFLQRRTWLRRASFSLAIVTTAAFFLGLVDWSMGNAFVISLEANYGRVPTAALAVLLPFDISGLASRPWLWCSLLAALLTIVIFIISDEISENIRLKENYSFSQIWLSIFPKMLKLRNLLAYAYYLIITVYALDLTGAFESPL